MLDLSGFIICLTIKKDFAKGLDKIIIDINVGEIQKVINIKNKGLRKNLKILEELKYLIYKEYDVGMYTISIN